MKFLFDFDGVLTHQTEEAHRVRELFEKKVSDLGHVSPAVSGALFAQAEAAMDQKPERHGWMSLGRVTAFANEDLFIRSNGIAALLDQWAYEGHLQLRDALASVRHEGLENFTALAQLSYQEMVHETRSGKMQPMDPKAGPLFEKLLSRGHEAVIVSNSGTDRIVDLLTKVGLPAGPHGTDPAPRLRVRGGAKKFELGPDSRCFEFEGFRIDTSRPTYESIIREELPKVVVGDVFSLDLALPHYLARTEPVTFGGMNLFLRVQHYTPEWSKRLVRESRDQSSTLHLLTDLDQLSDFIERQAP